MPSPKPLSLEAVTAKFPAETLARYDFSGAVYTGALNRITGIRCPEHGEFSQYPSQLRKGGSGCPRCGHDLRGQNKRITQDEAISKAVALHNGFYSYEKTVYTIGHEKMTVTCPLHGDFSVLAINHIYGGRGCPTCGAAKRGHRFTGANTAVRSGPVMIAKHAAKFEAQAREVHGDKYDYSQVDYKGRKTHVAILCPKHGPFQQTPDRHLSREHGCPECSHHLSKGEAQIKAFMSIFAQIDSRRRDIVKPKELDIYAPEHALAVEYCGEYWHGAETAEKEKDAETRHIDKMRACEARGIRLLTVFESDWLRRPHAIRRLIRNALGKGRGKVMARKCQPEKVAHAEAVAFFDRYHPQGGSGHGVYYGLRYGGKLVACMRFTFGGNDRGPNKERQWTLSRYATRISVVGGASRLLSAFVEDFDPSLIKSFSDNRYFTGAMYVQLGFDLDAELPPEYQVYHIKTGLLPKAAWQRREIPARIAQLGSKETFDPDPEKDSRTETTMTYLLGARRVYDCGKKRWIWRKKPA